MSKTEWGLKRICPSCGTRYYDMKKNPPVCPNCKASFDPEALLRARRRGPEKKAAAKDTADAVIDDLPLTDATAEDAVIEDAEELADEENVVEVEEEER